MMVGLSLDAPRRNERGAAMVEFALILPILLTLVLGITDFGRAFNYWIDQTHLANTAARLAVVNRYPGCSNVAAACGSSDCSATPLSLQCYTKSLADTAELRDTSAGAAVCMSYPTGSSLVGDPVKAEVKFQFNFLPWFSGTLGPALSAVTIVGSATMRIEAVPSTYSPTNNLSGC